MSFTLAFIIVTLVVIFGVDLWLLVKKGYKATVSATLLDMSMKFPIIAFLLGVVMGHILWPNLAMVKEAEDRCKQEVPSGANH